MGSFFILNPVNIYYNFPPKEILGWFLVQHVSLYDGFGIFSIDKTGSDNYLFFETRKICIYTNNTTKGPGDF